MTRQDFFETLRLSYDSSGLLGSLWHEGLLDINHIVLSQTKPAVRHQDLVIVPNSSRPDVQVHIARQHINIFSHAIIDLTGCITESVLISFYIFLNVYSSIYHVLEIIQKSFLGH